MTEMEINKWQRYYKVEDGKFVGFYLEKEGTSKEKNQFYEISKEEHERLMKGQAEGKSIVYENGKLTLIEFEETLNKDQLINLRKNKIIQFEKLEEEKKLLEKSKFSSEDEMKAITEKMAVIEEDINSLAEKIKGL
jgi:hypothetical protein